MLIEHQSGRHNDGLLVGFFGVEHMSSVHLDIDTTVEPLFGHQEGALPRPNPHYHGRPSYHPILGVESSGIRTKSMLNPRQIP